MEEDDMSTVLIVEDNDVISLLLCRLITKDNMDAIVVPLNEISNLLDSSNPYWLGVDALVCDISMPGVNGKDILAVAKEHHPHIYRVVLTGWYTGYGQPSEFDEFADVVKHKPDDVAEVVRLIHERLEGP